MLGVKQSHFRSVCAIFAYLQLSIWAIKSSFLDNLLRIFIIFIFISYELLNQVKIWRHNFSEFSFYFYIIFLPTFKKQLLSDAWVKLQRGFLDRAKRGVSIYVIHRLVDCNLEYKIVLKSKAIYQKWWLCRFYWFQNYGYCKLSSNYGRVFLFWFFSVFHIYFIPCHELFYFALYSVNIKLFSP